MNERRGSVVGKQDGTFQGYTSCVMSGQDREAFFGRRDRLIYRIERRYTFKNGNFFGYTS